MIEDADEIANPEKIKLTVALLALGVPLLRLDQKLCYYYLNGFIHSKWFQPVVCRIGELKRRFGGSCDAARWTAERDAVHADVLARGFSPARNAFVRAYDTDELDAANLLIPIVGFLPPDDPRVRGTVEAVQRELTSEEGFVYRNDMHGPRGSEGTFAICTFWLVEALVLLGEVPRARALFDRVTACANDLGLFAEHYDPLSGAQWGNFPQAYSHVGLIHAAFAVSEGWEEVL